MWINYHGLFQSPMSWAQVNREMVLALDRLDCKIAVLAYRGFRFDPTFPLSPRIISMRTIPKSPYCDVAFEYPLNYKRLQAQYKAALLVYETTELPPRWVDAICKHLDLLVVPSSFCQQVAIKSGVDPAMIVLIPYGFDPARFYSCPRPANRQGYQKKRFTFLCMAMPHQRKGVQELIQAFTEEFSPSEPVQLILKLSYLPEGGRRQKPWEIKSLDFLIQKQKNNEAEKPRILIFDRPEPPDRMPFWFALCDAYIQPSYSEGFGLSIIEAKAMGRPTIVTGWGGHMDFCTQDNSYLIDYELVPAGEAQYDHCSPSAKCARPLIDSLKNQMRTVFLNPEQARQKARNSLYDIGDYTWEKAAIRLLATLKERM